MAGGALGAFALAKIVGAALKPKKVKTASLNKLALSDATIRSLAEKREAQSRIIRTTQYPRPPTLPMDKLEVAEKLRLEKKLGASPIPRMRGLVGYAGDHASSRRTYAAELALLKGEAARARLEGKKYVAVRPALNEFFLGGDRGGSWRNRALFGGKQSKEQLSKVV